MGLGSIISTVGGAITGGLSSGGAFNPVAAIAGGLTALGSSKGVEEQNAANSAQSLRQMEFQREMSNTAHRRQVHDLRAAGLNPILSAGGGGASSPGGAQAQMQDVVTPALNTAATIRNLTANTQQTQAQTKAIQLENVGRELEAYAKGGALATAKALEAEIRKKHLDKEDNGGKEKHFNNPTAYKDILRKRALKKGKYENWEK